MTHRKLPEKFLVAFSYASEQKLLVRPVAEAVERALGENTVFLDEWYEYYIAGSDGDEKLQEIYGKRAELVVVCVSADYGKKVWTLAELEAIRARNMQLRASNDSRERILPLRVGDGDVKGIPANSLCPDVRKKSIDDTAGLIVNRLRLFRPDAGSSGASPGRPERFVYLAEVNSDLEDPERPVNRQRIRALLSNLGWTVLPRDTYEAEYQTRLEADLRNSAAFVQLRGAYEWKRGSDHLQNDLAMKLGLKRFVYRSSDIDLTKVEPQSHREFLGAPEVIFTGFDDFLVFLETELKLIDQKLAVAAKSDGGDNPPLVRVIARSAAPDTLWERVFQWIYVQDELLWEQLATDESFQSKHQVEPCQGFLVLCDSVALEDGPMSPRRDMEQCRLIQIREKDASRRPPVALIYWPPPNPSDATWARLLRSKPQKLFCAAADTVAREVPRELGEFFDEVRKVPR